MLRLQCNVCGCKSIPIESLPPSEKERRALSDFRAAHDSSCAKLDAINFPDGATSIERRVRHVGPFGSVKPPPRSVLKAHGHFEYIGPYGEIQGGDTLSCCHCRKHWEVRVGSGRTRGFCQQCAGHTCGHPECDACIPYEQRLWNVEHGLSALTPRLIMASVPAFPKDASDGLSCQASADRGPAQAPGVGA